MDKGLLYTRILQLLLFTLAAILVFYTFAHPIVATDSGYYLALARDFYEGQVYFKEVKTAYNPLAILLLGLPYLFSEETQYWQHQIIALGVGAAIVLVLYQLLSLFRKDSFFNSVLCFSFFALLVRLDGLSIMLEPISVLFQLLALYLYIKAKRHSTLSIFTLLLVGSMIGLAFFSKQYGLFILLPILIDVFLEKKDWLYRSFFISIGAGGVYMLFLGYMMYNGVGFYDAILHTLGKGIVLDFGNGTGVYYTFKEFLKGLLFLFKNFPLLFLILFYLLHPKIYNKDSGLFISCFLISFSVLKFGSFHHYYIYIIPYALLLAGYFQYQLDKKWTYLTAVIFSFYSLFSVSKDVYGFRSMKEKLSNEQQVFAQKLNLQIPKKSKVYFVGISPSYYYLCDFRALDSIIGYGFFHFYYPKTIANSFIQNKGYLVISKEEYEKQKLNLYLSTYQKTDCRVDKKDFFIIKNKD